MVIYYRFDEKRRPWYLLKWMGYEETSWTFSEMLAMDVLT
jgi:hypothetical protein